MKEDATRILMRHEGNPVLHAVRLLMKKKMSFCFIMMLVTIIYAVQMLNFQSL